MIVAHTIIEQLGGSKFVAMTGARDFVGGDRALTFRLPSRFAKNGINRVRVELTAADDYTVSFLAVRGTKFRTVEKCEGVYCENLREVFESATGLATSLIKPAPSCFGVWAK